MSTVARIIEQYDKGELPLDDAARALASFKYHSRPTPPPTVESRAEYEAWFDDIEWQGTDTWEEIEVFAEDQLLFRVLELRKEHPSTVS